MTSLSKWSGSRCVRSSDRDSYRRLRAIHTMSSTTEVPMPQCVEAFAELFLSRYPSIANVKPQSAWEGIRRWFESMQLIQAV